jgi:RNA polymerase sigma-70 factor (ECF subfamily)
VESRVQLAVPDARLVERLSRGDVSAFEALYDRYAHEVFVLAVHLLGRNDAEEIMQEVFLKLWQRAGQFDPARGSFTAWFMTIARHRVFDELKRRRNAVAVAEAVDDLLESIPDPGPDLDERASLAERRSAVLAAVGKLPDEQRRALVLAYFGGLSQSAIADSLDVPLGTVKKRLRLAVDKLRASLSGSPQVEDRERQEASRQGASAK